MILTTFNFFLLVVGEEPFFEMHAMIEANYHVRIGFPKVDDRYQLRMVGRPMNILKTIDFIGKLADGNYVQPIDTKIQTAPDYQYTREKLFCCFYCGKMYKFNIISHCQAMHAKEPEVAKIIALKKKDNEPADVVKKIEKERARLIEVGLILFHFSVYTYI